MSLWKRAECQTELKALKVDSSENHPRARLEFVKPIRNGPRKVQNLMESRPSKAETGLVGKENGVRLQKEELDAIK